MTRRAPRFRLSKIPQLFAVWSIKRLSRWLHKASYADWEKAVFSPIPGGIRSIHRQESVRYKEDKQEGLEIGHSKGSWGDTTHQVSALARPGVSLPQWAQEIQPFLQNQLSKHTQRAYETDLKHFFQFLEGRIDPKDLLRLRPEHIILYRKFLEEGRMTGKPLEKSTVNRKLAVVKSFLNWLRVNQHIQDNPAQLVKGYPQNQESSLKGLSDEEARKILELPNRNSKAGALHGAILTTLLYTGLRKGELIGLKMGDLDSERGVKVFKVRGKGHRVRILPLTKQVELALENYFFACRRDKSETEAPLFSPTKNPRTQRLDKPLNPHAITYMVTRYAKKSGVLKRISPHSCRATCISHALDKKASHRSVQYLAGWSTPLMIQRYDKRREDLHNSAAYSINYEEHTGAAPGA